MTYSQAVQWLYGLQLYGIKLGLENMRRLCAAMEIDLGRERSERAASEQPTPNTKEVHRANSETAVAPVFIHVAGTNGKGSVCAMLESICLAAGVRCGLYTSPHLVTFRERIRLDGAMISEADVTTGLARIQELVQPWDHPPTFFEVTTALALAWFQEHHADVAILETGLGGRLDATNVVTPAVAVLTPIALDHQQILGDTLAQIAAEKCGIIKPGVPVVSAPQEADAASVILETALRIGPPCKWVTEPWEVPVGLRGEHQRWNAALANLALDVAATEHEFFAIPSETIQKALASTKWPGRFQVVNDRVVLDGAHNPAGARALVSTWHAEYGSHAATIILGMMSDKDVNAVVSTLAPISARVFTVAVDNARALPAGQLADKVRSAAPGLPVQDFTSLAMALKAAEREKERVLITGSLFLIGAALVELGLAPEARERSNQ